MISTEISNPKLQMGFLRNKTENPDTHLEQFETDIKKKYHVTCRDNLAEYLFSSSLHGLRYCGDRRISHFERIFFACMFLVVLLLSIFFISSIWSKWQMSPIIISLSSEAISVKDLPFPAVTVCNMNQVRLSEIQNISKSSHAVIQGICRQDFYLESEAVTSTGTWEMYREMLLKVAPPCEDMLQWCEFGGLEFNCSSRFASILTDDGLCCQFNGVPKKYLMKTPFKGFDEFDKRQSFRVKGSMWTPESGYDQSTRMMKDEEKYPRPAVGSGNEVGLSLLLKADLHDYYCSSTRSYGFKVLLHSPNDLPKVAHYGLGIPTNYESRISITPTLSVATPPIRSIPPPIRQCIFEDENFLSFYSTYSDMNCVSECETKLIHEHCGCILYYQPRAHPNISICGTSAWKCIKAVDNEIQLKQNPLFKCDHCLNGCFSLNYDTTFSTAKIFDRLSIFKNDMDPRDSAFVHIYYSRSTFRSHKMEPLYGFTEFLSNCGGLLGLFMGFSVISIIEMFYYISIRPYCNYIRFSAKRRELMAKLYRKVDKLRQKKLSPFMITTVQSNPNFDDSYHRRYLD